MFSTIFEQIIVLLKQFSQVLPLPWFTFIGAFTEEVIAPIPSPLVMTLTGSLAASAGALWPYLILLSVLGALGKTLGSYLIYVIADKAEDILLGRFGRFIGVSHKQVEVIGKHLNKGWKDDVVIFVLRAIPIIPMAPVSIVCGLIKLNLRTYLVSTFLGTVVRNLFYIYLGFTSVNAIEAINNDIDGVEKFGYLILLGLLVAGVVYVLYHRKNDTGLKFLEKKPTHTKEE